MPARHHVIAIVAFWLATMGWLFHHDLWPRLRPGEPPPYTIDLGDEASEQKIYWSIFKGGEDKGYAQTWVKYHGRDDTFEVAGVAKLFAVTKSVGAPEWEVESMYRVNREGELRELRAVVSARIPSWLLELFPQHAGAGGKGDVPQVKGQIIGQVRDHQFHPSLEISGQGMTWRPDLKPVPVSSRGSVLNTLQPLNKMRGLRPGQHWRMPLVDPVKDALLAVADQMLPGFGRKMFDGPLLEVDVQRELQDLPELKLKPLENGVAITPRKWGFPCLVIHYVGDDLTARVWVRESDDAVLRQEITQHGQTLILDRD
jgi:hypothetical protein